MASIPDRIPPASSSLSPLSPQVPDGGRYSRQVLFPGIGPAGQALLGESHVAIVGVGATGAASAALLARAGVGRLTLIDRDFVEASNLQRQILFDEADAREALPKAEAARRKILLFNSGVEVEAHIADLTPANIRPLLGSAQLLLDATDNFETRYLLNDFAVQQGLPWIYAAAIGAYAATMTILPRCVTPPGGDVEPTVGRLRWASPTACLACVFPKPPSGPVETCDTAGILATAVNLAAAIQVTEALKLLTHQSDAIRRSLISFDLWSTAPSGGLDRSEILTGAPDPECEVCAKGNFVHLTGVGRPRITLCGRNSVQIHERDRPVDFKEMRLRLRAHPELSEVRSNELLLRFRRGPLLLTLFADGRAIIQGTTDIAMARALYARFVGS